MLSHRPVLLAATVLVSLTGSGAAWAEEAPGIIVYGRPGGYDTDETGSATKTQTPLLDVPQAISVLSREQLDDQGVDQLGQALRYVPGVTLGQGEGHRDQITIRGQNSTADFFLDGLRDDAQYYRALYNIERVEVLRGANALIFGRGGGGGVINRVSKAPVFSGTKASASAAVDSFGAWSVTGDIGAPMSDAVGLRLNATYEEFDNHRQEYAGHFIGITPTLGVKLGDATSFAVSYEYAQDRRNTDRGVPSRGGVPLTGYDETSFGSPAINRSEVTAHLVHARLDHEFSDALSVNLSGQFADYDKYYGNVYANSAVSAANTLTLAAYRTPTQRRNWIGQGNLVWKTSTGRIGHTLLLGFEAGDQNTVSTRQNGTFPGGAIVTLAQRITIPTVTFPATTSSTDSSVQTLSAYLQDQIDIGDHVKLVLGLRYDDFRISSVNRISGFAGARRDGKWSPRLGLILKPQANLSLYASYARSFLPQSGDQFTVLDATTQALAPEEFRNLEAGVKWDLTERLAFTLAAYQLDRSNTRANDPISGSVVLTGSTRVRGIEAGLVGEVTPELHLTLGYALQGGEIRATTTAAPAGRPLAQLPRHQASAWGRYDLSKSFGVALGVVHQSSQFATISNAVRLPAFTRVDAALFLDLSDRIALQLNVENLTDADYFPNAHTDNNISTGEPINARLAVRIKI
jgi:catecholate siderophore receptor